MKTLVAAIALSVVAGTSFVAPASAAAIHPIEVQKAAPVATQVGYYGGYYYYPRYRRHYYTYSYYGYGC